MRANRVAHNCRKSGANTLGVCNDIALLKVIVILMFILTPLRLQAQILTNEASEIRTPNLLIWSRTRYRCAIAPVASVGRSVGTSSANRIAVIIGRRKLHFGHVPSAIVIIAAHRVVNQW